MTCGDGDGSGPRRFDGCPEGGLAPVCNGLSLGARDAQAVGASIACLLGARAEEPYPGAWALCARHAGKELGVEGLHRSNASLWAADDAIWCGRRAALLRCRRWCLAVLRCALRLGWLLPLLLLLLRLLLLLLGG